MFDRRDVLQVIIGHTSSPPPIRGPTSLVAIVLRRVSRRKLSTRANTNWRPHASHHGCSASVFSRNGPRLCHAPGLFWEVITTALAEQRKRCQPLNSLRWTPDESFDVSMASTRVEGSNPLKSNASSTAWSLTLAMSLLGPVRLGPHFQISAALDGSEQLAQSEVCRPSD